MQSLTIWVIYFQIIIHLPNAKKFIHTDIITFLLIYDYDLGVMAIKTFIFRYIPAKAYQQTDPEECTDPS